MAKILINSNTKLDVGLSPVSDHLMVMFKSLLPCFLPTPASLLSSVHKPGRLFSDTFTLTHTSAALLPVLTLVNASYYGAGDYVATLKLKRLKKSTWLKTPPAP